MAKAMVEPRQAPRRRKAVDVPAGVESYWKLAQAGRGGAYLYVFLVGLKDLDPLTILKRISRGLAFESLERFQENTLFSARDVAELVSIPPRTLHRRKARGRLDPEESDRLLRVTRVFAKALGLFEGDVAAARNWFNTPARALGGEAPIRLARTDLGSREVETLIDRLEHGVLA
jgi:putative toxin-antitoxin system antitoxin component (TIGR02293 family)